MPAPTTSIDKTALARQLRQEFPLLGQQINGKPLVYLDNAATTQKPRVVIDSIKEYYEEYNSNVHRGVHQLSQKATEAMESTRRKVAGFIGAKRNEEIVFTGGTTGSINLVSAVLAQSNLKPGDEILITEMEHHSNIVPWQMACEKSGAVLKVARINDDGSLDLDHLLELMNTRTKLVSVVHVSNALGTINPVKEIIAHAKSFGATTLIDGAQTVAHSTVDVVDMDCDFYVFSGHKMYGPTGIGVLYGRYEVLEALPPYMGGGEMIERVTFEHTTYNAPPFKFEAGTPNIAGIIGLGAAIDWIADTGIDVLAHHEQELLRYGEDLLNSIEGFEPIGVAPKKANIISFNLKGLHPFDVGTLLDQMGIAVRTGHHCTQPLMDRYQIPGTVRASIAAYNSIEDIDRMVAGVRRAQQMLS